MNFEDFIKDTRIAENDHDERESVHDDESKDRIGQLICFGWKKVESDTLLVPLKLRMPFHVEYYCLREKKLISNCSNALRKSLTSLFVLLY